MSTLVVGFSRFIERPGPNSDVVVSEVVAEDGSQWVRVVGLDLPADYLTAAEASALAGALLAAADELTLRGVTSGNT
jgi:hypothetical protein